MAQFVRKIHDTPTRIAQGKNCRNKLIAQIFCRKLQRLCDETFSMRCTSNQSRSADYFGVTRLLKGKGNRELIEFGDNREFNVA